MVYLPRIESMVHINIFHPCNKDVDFIIEIFFMNFGYRILKFSAQFP